MAEMGINCLLISFTIIISRHFGNQVACDSDPELHRSRRNVIESYDAPQNVLFKYHEEQDARDSKYIVELSDHEAEQSETMSPFSIQKELKLCNELKKKLAKDAAGFIECSMLNARPITVCLNCVGSYNDTVNSYQHLMEASENGTNCKSVLVGKDKLEIIETMYGNVVNLWDEGNCDSCYETDASGLPHLSVVSNETLNFMQALKKVRDCFQGIKDVEKSGGTSNGTCVECKLLYEHLGEIFDGISKDMVNNQTEVVCVDITDAMNVTHHIWNNQLKCKLFGTGVGYALFLLTGSLSAVPVLFYLAAKILSNVETIHLVLPKRKLFAQDSTRLQL